MTSLDEHPGRPEDVQPWLRGWVEDAKPQTTVVWRKYLPVRRGSAATKTEINDFFEAAPPQMSEMLETETWRVVDWLFERVRGAIEAVYKPNNGGIASLPGNAPILFLLNSSGKMDSKDGQKALWTLNELADLEKKERKREREAFSTRLNERTIVMSAQLGGLGNNGMLDAKQCDAPLTIETDESWSSRSFRVNETDNPTPTSDKNWKEGFRFAIEKYDDGERRWIVVEDRTEQAETEESRSIKRRTQTLADHQVEAERIACLIAEKLELPVDYVGALTMAARWHDEGKDCWRWQRAFNAPCREIAYAKTKGPLNYKLLDGYRHEFGSLPTLERNNSLSPEFRDFVLHLVAAHHGGARPLISSRNCEAPAPPTIEERARDVALRFARLQHRWGPWGLAWWESLLRAADHQASGYNDENEDRRENTKTGGSV